MYSKRVPQLDLSVGRRTQYLISPIYEEEPPVDHYSPNKRRLDNERTKVPYEEATPSLRTIKLRYNI